MLNLPYDENTPFFADQAYVDNNLAAQVGDATNKAVHYTVIFNTFVYMQLFNQVNARKLGENDYNVFRGFFNNLYFLAISAFLFGSQLLLVQYGG